MPTLPSSRLELTQLLEEIGSFLRRFVVFTAVEQVDALALWVFHSHAVDAADVSPYVIVDSPEKQCGKSRLLDVTALLVRHAWRIDAIPSEAVLFRKIARDAPTVLLDEADAVFGAARERTEPVRALSPESTYGHVIDEFADAEKIDAQAAIQAARTRLVPRSLSQPAFSASNGPAKHAH